MSTGQYMMEVSGVYVYFVLECRLFIRSLSSPSFRGLFFNRKIKICLRLIFVRKVWSVRLEGQPLPVF